MSYSEFWEGDVSLPKFYRKAYELRYEREMEQTNFTAWLQGFYNTQGYAVVLGNAFAKEGADTLEYFDKPIPLGGKQEEDPEAARLRMRVALENFVNYYKKRE